MTTISEKEIQLAEDLQNKLAGIENPLKRKRKAKVSQTVVSPRDEEVSKDIGDMDKLNQKLASLDQPKASTHPDPKKHLYISLVKSFLRLGAGVALCIYGLPIVGGLFIVAEVLGVAEELV